MQREVLEFARGETHDLHPQGLPAKFFGDFERQLRLELEGTKVELVLDVDSKGVARFDEGAMTRAIHNLARNAIEAMGEQGGKLTIGPRACRAESSSSTVGDTGPGIPTEIEGSCSSLREHGQARRHRPGARDREKDRRRALGTISVSSSRKGPSFELRLPQAAQGERGQGGLGESRA